MNIFVSGINYKTTPLEKREKLSFSDGEKKEVMTEVLKLPEAGECIMLSTCNRTEVYVYSGNERFDVGMVEKLLCEAKGLDIYSMKKHFYAYSGINAVKHVLRVACGLDSQVLGEDQILGQIKSAHELSLKAGASSCVLNTLFRDAVAAAKKVKTCTQLSRNPISTGSIAVKLAENVFNGSLKGKKALVIGTGQIGAIVLKNLASREMEKILATARTHCRAGGLSDKFANVERINYDSRYYFIKECDVIVSSTGSPHYTITKDILEKEVSFDKERIFIDLAVPRDIDSSIKELPRVRYFNIDDLQAVTDENLDRRLIEASKAEQLVDEYAGQFERWYEFRNALPVINEIQMIVGSIVEKKSARALTRLKCASQEDKEIVKASIACTANAIMNKLVYNIKKCGSKHDVQAYLRYLGRIIKE